MSDEIRVGDRFEYTEGPPCPATVVEVGPGASVRLRTDSGACGFSHSRNFLLGPDCRRLPSAKPKAPEPRKGQRWKCVKAIGGRPEVEVGKVYSLEKADRAGDWFSDGLCFHSVRFRDGTLEYIGEGEAPGAFFPTGLIDRAIVDKQPPGSIEVMSGVFVTPLPESRKQHRWDKYSVRDGSLACVDCGNHIVADPACTPVPYWRETYERTITTKTIAADSRAANVRISAALDKLDEAQPRYDARTLLASPGLGPETLVCRVRGIRGPL